MDGWPSLVVAALALWRVSALLWYEHGPGHIFDRLRGWIAGRGEVWAELIGCFWCVSLWLSVPVALLWWLWWYALIPFALSGAVILLSHGGRVLWTEMREAADHE